MEYKGLTVEQHERVVELSKRANKTYDVLVDEIIDWCKCYDSIDAILEDYEDTIDIQEFEKENNVIVMEYSK